LSEGLQPSTRFEYFIVIVIPLDEPNDFLQNPSAHLAVSFLYVFSDAFFSNFLKKVSQKLFRFTFLYDYKLCAAGFGAAALICLAFCSRVSLSLVRFLSLFVAKKRKK